MTADFVDHDVQRLSVVASMGQQVMLIVMFVQFCNVRVRVRNVDVLCIIMLYFNHNLKSQMQMLRSLLTS